MNLFFFSLSFCVMEIFNVLLAYLFSLIIDTENHWTIVVSNFLPTIFLCIIKYFIHDLLCFGRFSSIIYLYLYLFILFPFFIYLYVLASLFFPSLRLGTLMKLRHRIMGNLTLNTILVKYKYKNDILDIRLSFLLNKRKSFHIFHPPSNSFVG